MYLSVRTGRGHLLGDQDLAVTDISVFLPQIYHILALFHLWPDGTLGRKGVAPSESQATDSTFHLTTFPRGEGYSRGSKGLLWCAVLARINCPSLGGHIVGKPACIQGCWTPVHFFR